MKKCFASLVRFLSDEQANTSVEYAAMLSMILLTVNVSVETLGTSVSGKYNQASGAFASSNNNAGNSAPASPQNSGPLQGNGNPRGTGMGKGQGSGNGNGNGG